MTVYVGAEGAVNGTDVSSTTLTAGGDTALQNIAKNTPATIKHSTTRAHTGTRSIQFAWASNTAGYIRWTHESTGRTVASTYLWLDNYPSNYLELFAIRYASGQAARFALSSGYATLTATTTVRDAALIPTGQWLRIELVATPGGSAELYLYYEDATDPFWSATSAAVGNGAPFTLVSIGSSSQAGTATTAYFDDVRAEERVSGLLGPYPPVAANFNGTAATSGSGDLAATAAPAPRSTADGSGASALSAVGAPRVVSQAVSDGVGSLLSSGAPRVTSGAAGSSVGSTAFVGRPQLRFSTAGAGTGANSSVAVPRPNAFFAADGMGSLTAYAVQKLTPYGAVLNVSRSAETGLFISTNLRTKVTVRS